MFASDFHSPVCYTVLEDKTPLLRNYQTHKLVRTSAYCVVKSIIKNVKENVFILTLGINESVRISKEKYTVTFTKASQ